MLVSITELKIEAWEFSAIIDHFKRDKVDLKNENIRFSHPSYSEAIKYIIFDKRRKITKIGEILEKVLLRLANYNYYDYNVAIARIIADNFNLMPNEVQKLFFKLANDHNLLWIMSIDIISNFDKMSDEGKKLIFKLADDSYDEVHYGRDSIGNAIESQFDNIPESIRNELLIKLADSDNKEAAEV